MTIAQDIAGTLAKAVLIPVSLLVTLMIVRGISYIWYVLLNRRALPIIINPPPLQQDQASSADTLSGDQPRRLDWQSLPSLLRDYVALDPPLSRQLAPGVTSAASPEIPTAAPGAGQATWSSALVNLVLPQKQAAYNLYIAPQHQFGTTPSVGVQVIKTPEQWIIASRTFEEQTTQDLVFAIGGFCIESVLLEPGFLRRTPRWEHWGNRGAYGLFRRAVSFQESGNTKTAHKYYEQASRLSPGNIRLGVHRASLYELEGSYAHATMLYDALHCVWKKNIEVIYRSAAARGNYALELLEPRLERRETPTDQRVDRADAQDAADQELKGSSSTRGESLVKAGRLLRESLALFELANRNLHYPHVLWKWFQTRLPMRRDLGERRYWASWLRRDSFRQPLVLLRSTSDMSI